MVIYYHPLLVGNTGCFDEFFLNNYQPLNTIMIILLLTTRFIN